MKKNQSLKTDFFFYLHKPEFQINFSKMNFRAKAWSIFQLWSFALLVITVFSIFSSGLIRESGYDVSQNKIVDLISNYPIYIFVLMAFIWAPITEEIVFRLWLRCSPFNLSISFGFLTMFLLDFFSVRWGLLERFLSVISLKTYWLFAVIIYLLVFILVSKLFNFLIKQLKQKKIKIFYTRFFPVLFYFSAFSFAFLHIYNYKEFTQAGWSLPLLVLPQFIIALALGYARMRFGFGWSMFLHFLHNGLLTLPIILFSFVSPQIFETLEKGQTIDVNNISFLDETVILSLGFFFLFFLASMLTALIDFFKMKTKV